MHLEIQGEIGIEKEPSIQESGLREKVDDGDEDRKREREGLACKCLEFLVQ